MKKGRHHSLATRLKMSLDRQGANHPLYGKHWSEETRAKIVKALTGRIGKRGPQNPLFGRHLSIETRKKLSECRSGEKSPRYGKPMHENARKALLKSHLGKHDSKETLEKRSKSLRAAFLNPEIRKKRSLAVIGPKNPNWKGGKNFEPYAPEFNIVLKKQIRLRDKYSCRLCNLPENSHAHPVHHIDYDKKNNLEENLITLCPNCHSLTNAHREQWTNFFQGVLK